MLALGESLSTVLLITSLLLTAASMIIRKKPKIANLDDALQSTATQGAFLPLVIGRQRVGHVVAFVEDTTDKAKALTSRSSGFLNSFAKGNGGTPSQPVYWERALHLLCVGPASELRSIYQNGELVWNGFATPQTAPSGTFFDLDNNEGRFQVFWGFADDPVVPGLAASAKHGIATRYPLAMKILWDSKNLGQSRQWPRLEYEVVCPCYSQIALTPTEVPREGVDNLVFNDNTFKLSDYVGAPGYVNGDKAEISVIAYNPTKRELTLRDTSLTYGAPLAPLAQEFVLAGDVVKVWTTNNAVVGWSWFESLGMFDISTLLPTNNQWRYFYVVKATKRQDLNDPNFPNAAELKITLGAEVDPSFLLEVDDTPPRFSSLPAGAVPNGALSPGGGGGLARLQLLASRNSDGVNPIHLIDQLLFAKYPYGAGKNRSKFDIKSIEEAALILQEEKIRAGIAVLDGEGLESVLAPLLTDIATQIVWDIEVGKHVFRPIREEAATVDLPADVILQQPGMGAPAGNRLADVLAFTFNDRTRNYREVPLRLMDSGQIAEYESQRSRKLAIEVTQDRDSVARLMPRLQQTAFANQAIMTFETNRATRLACAGTRFKASAVEGPEFQFMVTSVQRDLNSPKVKIEALLDVYQIPSLLPGERAKSDLPTAVEPTKTIFVPPQMAAFSVLEVPWALADGSADLQMLFLAARGSGATNSSVVWLSRDGSSFAPAGYAVIAARGELVDALPAGPSVDEGSYAFSCPAEQVFEDTLSLGADPLSWAAGVQLLLIGSEVIFVQEASITSLTPVQSGLLSGLLRGRAGSVQTSHPAGTEFWVLRLQSVEITKNPLLAIGASCEAKAQGITLRGVSDIAEATAVSFSPTGAAFTPPRPTGLRLSSFLTTYNPATDLAFRWNYFARLFPRTGLGFQPFGTQIGTSPPAGEFVVQILDASMTVLKEDIVATNSYTMKVADRATYSLDAAPSWSIRVIHRAGAFSSPPAILTLYP